MTSSSNNHTKSNIHSGHRDRMRKVFLEHGLDAFPDVNVLELLLFYAVPRQDTNPIAHRLMDAFGSLPAVLSASPEELMRHGGLTENAAALIKLIIETARRQQICRLKPGAILTSTEQCGEYMLPFFYGAPNETVYLLALDGKCKVLGYSNMFSGSVSSASLNIRSVVEYALRVNASSVVLAHNHVSGIALPSQADIQTTRALESALDTVEIFLADHIVVAEGDFVSMLDSGLLRDRSSFIR